MSWLREGLLKKTVFSVSFMAIIICLFLSVSIRTKAEEGTNNTEIIETETVKSEDSDYYNLNNITGSEAIEEGMLESEEADQNENASVFVVDSDKATILEKIETETSEIEQLDQEDDFSESSEEIVQTIKGTKTNVQNRTEEGWRNEDGRKYYYDPNTGKRVTGFLELGGNTFFLNPSGAMQTGLGTINNNTYYFDPVSGAMQYGWQTINGRVYYFDQTTGVMQRGFCTLDGQTFFFNPSGAMQTGWGTIGGRKFYFDLATGVMNIGWLDLDGKTFFFNPSGAMQTNWGTIDGKRYLFNSNSGSMVKGWVTTNNGRRYYLDPITGAMNTGWLDIDGKTYFFNPSGTMQTNWGTIDGKRYLFNSNSGSMVKGWVSTSDGRRYYLDPETGVMYTGWLTLNEKTYFFNPSGALQVGFGTIDGTRYYFTNDGLSSETGLFPDGQYYSYIVNGIFDPTYNGMASISGYSKSYKVTNGRVSAYLIPPTATLANRADQILNSVGWNLRAAFNWCVMQYETYTTGGERGTAYYANYGMNNHRGNCYCMAASFVVLARELGYEAIQISGYVAGTYIHSWTEVKVDGTYYVFDPDFVVDQGRNGYQIQYGQSGTWRYTDAYRMSN